MLETCALIVAVLGEDVSDASRRLTAAGVEMSLPGFVDDPALLNFGFGKQSEMPSPAGSLAKTPKVISTKPYAVLFEDFLSPRECEFLMSLGVNRLKPAMVVQSGDNWYDTQMQTRNNEQVWLTQPEERDVPVLTHIMKRIHRTTRVPDEYAEALQIGRYKISQKYEGHVDTDPSNKVARPATMLIYLNDVEEGGETIFPVGRTDCGAVWRKHPTTGEDVYGAKFCCESPELDTPDTIRLTAKQGRAVMFFSHDPTGDVQPRSHHIACPIIKGEKWVVQRWLRYEPYNRVRYDQAGFDARFDGLPRDEFRVSSREESHTRVISQIKPKLFMQEHFLDAAEIAHLRGFIGDADVKEVFLDKILSQEEIDEDQTLTALTERALVLALLPPNTVPVVIKLRRFVEGESEPAHAGATPPDNPTAVTVKMYLETIEDGGEIFFPGGRVDLSSCNADLVACCQATELKFRPRKGDAVLVYSYAQSGRLDSWARHGHCPVKKGESWVAEWRFLFETKEQGAPASKPLNVQPKVLFDNQGSADVEIFWVAAKSGKETSMGVVAGQGTKSLNSHAGHIFAGRDSAGKLLDRFTVGSTAHQRFIITDKAEL